MAILANSIRVTFVLPHADLSGGSRVLAIHAAELYRRGHDVCVVSQPARVPSLRSRARDLLKGRWPIRDHTTTRSHLDCFELPHRVLERARPVSDADLPDAEVVIATWWETAEWVAGLSMAKGAKVHFLQGYEVGDMWPGIPVERSTAVWRLPFHRIAVSHWLCEIGRSKFGCRQIDLVPNAVDHDQFRTGSRERGTRPTVGFVWSNTSFKGCDIAIDAVLKLRQRLPQLRCVVFGHGVRAAELPDWAEYHAQPLQPRIPELYASADVWLWPSRFEGFGLPILEAMACRTPVVATPAGAAPELIAQGGGILVPHDDPAAMAEAAARLLTCPAEEWAAASVRAHAVAASYTWERSTDLFEQSLYRAIETAAADRRLSASAH